MNKKFVGVLIFSLVFAAIGLPYGAYNWDAFAQGDYNYNYGSDDAAVVIVDDALRIAHDGESFEMFNSGEFLEVWGLCATSSDGCQFLANIDVSELSGTTTVYSDGVWEIVAVSISDTSGLWELNFYQNGDLFNTQVEFLVADGGLVYVRIR